LCSPELSLCQTLTVVALLRLSRNRILGQSSGCRCSATPGDFENCKDALRMEARSSRGSALDSLKAEEACGMVTESNRGCRDGLVTYFRGNAWDRKWGCQVDELCKSK
jgi:hypothetical protein